MKLIQPTFKILRPESRDAGVASLRFIEYCARISHRSEEAQTDESWDRFLRANVIGHGDWSVVEHAYASVEFRVNRGVTHELVRHRLFSYTQESTRFVNGRKSYPEGLEFILPADSAGTTVHLPVSGVLWPEAKEEDVSFLDFLALCENVYLRLLDNSWRPQEARCVLPNALAATIVVTGNLRNWRHLFLMRTSKETHPDFKQVMIPLLAEFQQRIPVLFEDIVPEARQVDNLKMVR